MAQEYLAPKFSLVSKRMSELPFVSSIGASTWLTIITSPIAYPFRIIQAKMTFTDEARNLVQHSWFTSRNASVSTTTYPSGDNLFGKEMTIAYFIGKAIEKVVNCNIEITDVPSYIKMCTRNLNPYTYLINCTLTIVEM